MSEKKNLASKIAKIALEIGAIKPKGWNDNQRYAYFTDAQLMAEVGLRLSKAGIIVWSSVDSVETKETTTKKGDTQQFVTVKTTHVFTDCETGEVQTVTSAGQGVDAGDKGIYKAITGSFKYVLMKLVFITDNADPERDEGRHSPYREEKKATATDSPTAQADLATLKAWMNENDISEEFIMELAAKGKLATKEKSLDELKPGTLTRLLGYRSTILERKAGVPKPEKKDRREGAAAKMAEKVNKNERDELDQRTRNDGEFRTPAQDSITSEEYLEQEGMAWRSVEIHFGKKKGTTLGELKKEDLMWWITNWFPKPYKGKVADENYLLDAALCVAQRELSEDMNPA